MGGSSGGGGTNTTVTSQTAIPDWQQGAVQANENLATSLSSQPYPNYQGQLIAGFTPLQQQGMQMTQTAAGAAQPDLTQAENYVNQAGQNTWNPQTAQQYMSPYAQQALAPQVQALQLQQAQQANAINGRATQAGAYGDAQYGNQQAINNFLGNQNLAGVEAQGMNTAYNTGLGAFQQNQANLLNAGQGLSQLGGQEQSTGLAGANAVFNAGTQQQQLNQSQLTEAYQNYMNQVNWPYQQLNARIAATANSPYQVPTANLAPTSSTAQNVGAFASLAGGVGSLLGGGGSGSGGSGGVYGASTSDRRLKKWIRKIGEYTKDVGIYMYSYIWEDAPRIGVMADEVEKVFPHAVSFDNQGYKMVHYMRLA